MTYNSDPAMVSFNPGMMPRQRTLPPPPIAEGLDTRPDFDAISIPFPEGVTPQVWEEGPRDDLSVNIVDTETTTDEITADAEADRQRALDAVFGNREAVRAIRRQLNGGNPDQINREQSSWHRK